MAFSPCFFTLTSQDVKIFSHASPYSFMNMFESSNGAPCFSSFVIKICKFFNCVLFY